MVARSNQDWYGRNRGEGIPEKSRRIRGGMLLVEQVARNQHGVRRPVGGTLENPGECVAQALPTPVADSGGHNRVGEARIEMDVRRVDDLHTSYIPGVIRVNPKPRVS